jgi:DmsE family decaheme c-type cytochrome
MRIPIPTTGRAVWLVLVCLVALGAYAVGAPSGYAGSEACATCHDQIAAALAKTTHGKTTRMTWEGASGCEACHGPGAAHVDGGGDVTKMRNPENLPAGELSGICLACHERGNRTYWQGSQHDSRGVSCTTCHSIHEPVGTPLLAKSTQFESCTTCHLRKKAALMRSSHMPMREGTMQCSSCHNPHGSTGPAQLKQFSVNENCYSCHAEKRSPVLWEHPPVKENCLNCHDPHGSLHPRMLNAKQPRLCQQCHDEMRHPTQPHSSSQAAAFFPSSRTFNRGCANCHQMIHGSNHPSGVRFMR